MNRNHRIGIVHAMLALLMLAGIGLSVLVTWFIPLGR